VKRRTPNGYEDEAAPARGVGLDQRAPREGGLTQASDQKNGEPMGSPFDTVACDGFV
jgi:hypothetical protein